MTKCHDQIKLQKSPLWLNGSRRLRVLLDREGMVAGDRNGGRGRKPRAYILSYEHLVERANQE